MAIKKIKFLEVYPAQEQERRMLVDLDEFVISSPGGSAGGVGSEATNPPTAAPAVASTAPLEEMIWFLS